MTSSANPQAAAILAVYNAESSIIACLESLLTQSVPLEIIIVDDGSTDQTVILIQELIKDLPKQFVKLLMQTHQGPAIARNLGADHSTANILLFVDADMTFDKNYVKDLITPIQKDQVSGTYTTEERVSNWDNPWARCWNLQEGWVAKKRFPPNPPKYGTDFRAILKSKFISVGGFDNIGYTDTWSLFNKLGEKPLATPAVCYHKNPDTLSSVYVQARWSAKRPYKYGAIGSLYALLRSSLPISLLVGTYKSLLHANFYFLIFKIIYDFGRFVGITEMITGGKLSK